jgi:hypothetical protein
MQGSKAARKDVEVVRAPFSVVVVVDFPFDQTDCISTYKICTKQTTYISPSSLLSSSWAISEGGGERTTDAAGLFTPDIEGLPVFCCCLFLSY